MKKEKGIIVFNAGSSSLKFSFHNTSNYESLIYGQVDALLHEPRLWLNDKDGDCIHQQADFQPGYESAIHAVLRWFASNADHFDIVAAGHRVVHGGKYFNAAQRVDAELLKQLKALIPLAPLHQPHNIAVIEALALACPDIPHIVCFDTAFHQYMPPEERHFAIPRHLTEEGVIRYGFHGLSYHYITSILSQYTQAKKIVIAHLGNGSSMCAVDEGRSVATTMGFTALDGLVMGTRAGTIDPGILLYLLESKKLSVKAVTDLLYTESGLKGISGISHDMRDLINSDKAEAEEAISLFCHQAAKQLAGLIPALGGLEALVFTAGIGAGSAIIRKNICQKLQWLGLEIDEAANANGQIKISSKASKVELFVLATNEELIIAKQTDELRKTL